MKKIRSLYLVFLLVALFVVIFVSAIDETKDLNTILKYSEGSFLYFSQEESFHSDDFEIGIHKDTALPKEAVIYYTLDGNNPTRESIVYEKPIKITVSENIEATVIRATVLFKGEYSEIYSKTYFHSKNINELNDLLLVSVVSDEHGLYDYDEGILVTGRPYDDFFRDNEDAQSVPFWRIPANFKLLRGRENEKDAHVEMFLGESDPKISQSIGLTLSGGASSYMDVKSLKLVARKDYDTNNSKFVYDFYNNGKKEYSELPILRSYNRLVMRNAAQDRGRSFIKWNVCSTLASQSGLPCVVPARPAIVYLNGEYYGMTQMQPSYSNYYLSKSFSLKEGFIGIYDSQERPALINAGVNNLVLQDLSIEENAKALENAMDIDDMLLYYAFEMYINNADWPDNNYKLWRYTGEKISGNKYSDNRLRPLLYDLDVAFNATQRDVFSILLDEPEERVSFLIRLMENERFKNKFINIINDLLASSLKAENIIKIVDNEEEKIVFYEKDPVFGGKVRADLSRNRKEHIDNIKEFAIKREDAVREYVSDFFNVLDTYTLNIKSPEKGTIRWSSLSLSQGEGEFSGKYYSEIPLGISPDIAEGFVFDSWIVNGKAVRIKNLTLTKEDVVDGRVDVELVVKRQTEGSKILINEFAAEGENDWIELYNPYEKGISLKGLYISDDGDNLFKSPLPDIVLEGDSYLVIHCKNNKVLSTYTSNFNIKTGETLYITKSGGTVLDFVYIPQMDKSESYGRLEGKNYFVFFSKPTPGEAN